MSNEFPSLKIKNAFLKEFRIEISRFDCSFCKTNKGKTFGKSFLGNC